MSCPLPTFLPVYMPRDPIVSVERWNAERWFDGCIVNAYFLYKQRELRQTLASTRGLKTFLGFNGVVMTDSGAFQGLSRAVFLENTTIVAFQEAIGADIVSPLDLITPPGDNRRTAEAKVIATNKRVAEALALLTEATLAGVQQGGRFRDLRQRSTDALLALGVRYFAIGSLVPFFNRNHDLVFAGRVIRDMRAQIGPDLPIHVFGAGDPVELPFFIALGADIFDSSSYAHFANDGWYMTPYGAAQNLATIADAPPCLCPACRDHGPEQVIATRPLLALHNLAVLHQTIAWARQAIETGTVEGWLRAILERHRRWFPQSALPASWERLLADAAA
ncbi:MAG: tRNA-guanine transglycosylase [Dehalococcoidia bacterium]|nr:tRNA-guanine transglycosylase [Dehalococcoidia bacterium]